MIDLRSDTVTKPTLEMRRAMFEAEVGDDARGEDPTVRRLEEIAADTLGKAAAVLVSSGTMGNLVCVMAHCDRGDEIIVGETSHLFRNESGGVSALGGIHVRTVADPRGIPSLADVDSAIRSPDRAFPRSRLLCLENTHNEASGAALGPAVMAPLAHVAHARGLATHLDGARVFNSAVALGVEPSELVRQMDSVTFCLSKGLGGPVGSLACGSEPFIARVRAYRKMVGGNMRQAGVIAAAGIVALTTMVDRLAQDHERARRLADGLAQTYGLRIIDASSVVTNIIRFEVTSCPATRLVDELADRGVLCIATGYESVRMMTHREIADTHIDRTLKIVGDVMKAMQGRSK
jgi:threonine aldolase